MSKSRDKVAQLGHAEKLFHASAAAASVDLFTELLREPEIRLAAARKFLDLFVSFDSAIRLQEVVKLLRLSFEVLDQHQATEEAKHRSGQIRSVLTKRYELPKSLRVPSILKTYSVLDESLLPAAQKKSKSDHVHILLGDDIGGEKIVLGDNLAGRDIILAEPTHRNVTTDLGKHDRIRRTPHMDLPDPLPLHAGEQFELHIYADKEGTRPEEQSDEIILPGGKAEYLLRVFLALPSGMSHCGPDSQTLVIVPNQDRSADVIFTVRNIVEIKPNVGNAISAMFSYEGSPSGRVTRLIGALPAGSEPPEAGVEFALDREKPDLTVVIVAKVIDSDRHFMCEVSTPYLPDLKIKAPKDWYVKQIAADIVDGAMKRSRDPGVGERQRIAALRVAGLDLFEASPDAFKEVFWKLVDLKIAIKSMLIVSEEMTFPWELMIPNRDESEWEYPLGAEIAIGRWITRKNDSPPHLVRLFDAYIIAPEYSAERELKGGPKEIKNLEACLSKSRCVIIKPPDVNTIDDFLLKRGRTLLHFICHGETALIGDSNLLDRTDQFIYLDNEKPLSAKEIRGLQGFRNACRQQHPLIFMNACEVGRPIPALRGTGGFPDSFIRIGASGVVAALWGVKDTVASKIARLFYRTLRKNKVIRTADFFRVLRKRAYQPKRSEDTYAAYCFYGHPFAEIMIAPACDGK
jgi:hypothetical protein